MDLGLAARVALVTGADSGIGRAAARLLAAEGCRIAAADLSAPRAEPGEFGAEPLLLAADVSVPAEVEAMVSRVGAELGRLDVLVCSAGVYGTATLDQLDEARWDRTLNVNLRGSYLCARQAIPFMAENSWGRILFLSSLAALTGGSPSDPAYVSSKAGVMGLTRALAKQTVGTGITVNCINPGIIETPMTAQLELEEWARRTPVRRNGMADDIASALCMLASDRAGFVNGAHLSVNGGVYAD